MAFPSDVPERLINKKPNASIPSIERPETEETSSMTTSATQRPRFCRATKKRDKTRDFWTIRADSKEEADRFRRFENQSSDPDDDSREKRDFKKDAPTTSLFGAFFRSRMAVATSLVLSLFFFSSAFSGALSPSPPGVCASFEDAMSR